MTNAIGARWLSTLVDPVTRPLRLLNETLRPNPGPRWTTSNRILHEDDAHRLRDFSPAPTVAADVPLLVVPPEINQSYIVDFGPGQSLVAAALDAGLPRVTAIEWRSASTSRRAARRDIDDSVHTILEAIRTLGGRAHVLGVCQGGWESAIAAALAPDATATLTLVAAPIDFHAGRGVLKQLARLTPMTTYRGLVGHGLGVMRGSFISAGFDTLRPAERFLRGPLALWNRLDDDVWMNRHHQLQDWYRCPKDLPGPLYLRAVRELFKENRLIQGRFVALGRTARLEAITCPLCLVAGGRDHITPPPQVWAAKQACSSTDVLEVETDGGHIGTFMGRQELARHWPGIFAWLKAHDT
ncbi:MAG: alpha/beta fold hydrolase [bacterium]